MNPNTYDRRLKARLGVYDLQTEDILNSNLGIFVFDNYNHQYGDPRLSDKRTQQLAVANYTVMALRPKEVKINDLLSPTGILSFFRVC